MTTVVTNLKAITPTANAKSVVQTKGADISSLMLLAQQHGVELNNVITQILALHPTGGGDAANVTALQAIQALLP
ncbi:hypothetical protein [Bradyrhizobium sp. Tv2a-2]|uniref:hypothetical protein n=1 Tax=Bradyrhizobium sp. Tv2a-2 TaxID=113395 RepID=UPI0003F7B427|nr:hypothetical protein [Bradyrhizobium sp. Tv2a-2]